MLQKIGAKQDAVPESTFRCPHCGLCLEVSHSGGQSRLSYDFAAWDRLCKAPCGGGPSVCLMLRDAPAQRAGGYRGH